MNHKFFRISFPHIRGIIPLIMYGFMCVQTITWISGQDQRNTRPIDLTNHYARTLASMPAHEMWTDIPDGLNNYDGVPFDCRGILELTGMTGFDGNNIRMAHTGNIPIVDRCDVIHLLSCTTWQDNAGVVIARMILNYEDGEIEEIPIAQVVHTDKFWNPTSVISNDTSKYPNMKNVWSAKSSQHSSLTLKMYRASFANPRPDQIIKSIDFESTFSQSMPVILGLTIEKSPDLRETVVANMAKEPELDINANVGDIIRIGLVDKESRTPVTKAIVSARSRVAELQFVMGTYYPNKEGKIPLRFPQRPFYAVDLEISADGYAPVKKTITAGTDGLPDEYEFKLERGTSIGGIVEDVLGNPISGASVFVDTILQDADGKFFLSPGFPVTTAENGTWSHMVELSSDADLTIRVEHKDFMAMQYELPPSRSPYTLTRNELKNRTAMMALLPAPKVEGRLVSEDGSPLSEVQIQVLDPVSYQNRHTIESNAEGQFNFTLTHEYPVLMVFQKSGYSPHKQIIVPKSGLNHTEIKINVGNILKSQVVDSSGMPVTSADVELTSWNGQKILEWKTQTDSDGNFVWDGAPEGNLVFNIKKEGYKPITLKYRTNNPVTQILMDKLPHLRGSVTDSQSGEKIDSFFVVSGYSYDESFAEENIQWMNSNRSYEEKGDFYMDLVPFNGRKIKLRISARGYVPVESDVIETFQASEISFKLEKARKIEGFVKANNDTPLPGVEVIAVPRGNMYQYSYPEIIPRVNASFNISKTDQNGKFTIPPQVDKFSLIFLHDSGMNVLKDLNDKNLADVRLKSWGTINGTLKSHEEIPWKTGKQVYLTKAYYGGSSMLDTTLTIRMNTVTDNSGTFIFTRVPPGEYQVGRVYTASNSVVPMSHGVGLRVEEAETVSVTIGGQGKPLKGKFELVGEGWPTIQWSEMAFFLVLQQIDPAMPLPPKIPTGTPMEETRSIYNEYSQKMQAYQQSDQGIAFQREQRSYWVHMEEDGSFHVDDVPDGEYRLNLVATPDMINNREMRTAMNSFNTIRTIQVSSDNGENEIDIGTLEVQHNQR